MFLTKTQCHKVEMLYSYITDVVLVVPRAWKSGIALGKVLGRGHFS